MRVLKAGYVEVEPTIRMGEELRLRIPEVNPLKPGETRTFTFAELEKDEDWQRERVEHEEEIILNAERPGRIKMAFNRDGCLLWIKLTEFKTPMSTYAPYVKEPKPPYNTWARQLVEMHGGTPTMEPADDMR